MICGAVFFVLTRPTLWNVFGKECIIMTTDEFSFYRDYGLYKTQMENKKIRLGILATIEQQMVWNEEPHVIMLFYNQLSEDDFEELMITSIKTPEKNFDLICELIKELFDNYQHPYSHSLN